MLDRRGLKPKWLLGVINNLYDLTGGVHFLGEKIQSVCQAREEARNSVKMRWKRE